MRGSAALAVFLFSFPIISAEGIGAAPPEVDLTSGPGEVYLINPNDHEIRFRASAPQGILIGKMNGTIPSHESIKIPIRSEGSEGGKLTFSIEGAGSITPAVSVRLIDEPGSEEVFRARKIIDYASLKGYTGHIWNAIRGMDTEKKGLLIMAFEVLIGIGLYRIVKNRMR